MFKVGDMVVIDPNSIHNQRKIAHELSLHKSYEVLCTQGHGDLVSIRNDRGYVESYFSKRFLLCTVSTPAVPITPPAPTASIAIPKCPFKVGDKVTPLAHNFIDRLGVTMGKTYIVERTLSDYHIEIREDNGTLCSWIHTRFELTGEKSVTSTIVVAPQAKVTCECGKDKHGFASHSSWCPIA